MKYLRIGAFFLISTIFISCGENNGPPSIEPGKIQFRFEHKVNGEDIVFDQLIYKNEAGNQYLVNEIQYFISDVTLHKSDGSNQVLNAWDDMVYIDSDIPNSHSHTFPDDIEPGAYKAISFTFGIDEEKNQSLTFVNPPESLMFWPELLGGGYHYMKLNGKWLDTLNQISPFNFHLGIGQIYNSYPDDIASYIHNHFKVDLDNSDFEILADQTIEIKIVMNVENWFKDPNVYNHDVWGGDIMQNQDAMKVGCENGHNVFTFQK